MRPVGQKKTCWSKASNCLNSSHHYLFGYCKLIIFFRKRCNIDWLQWFVVAFLVAKNDFNLQLQLENPLIPKRLEPMPTWGSSKKNRYYIGCPAVGSWSIHDRNLLVGGENFTYLGDVSFTYKNIGAINHPLILSTYHGHPSSFTKKTLRRSVETPHGPPVSPGRMRIPMSHPGCSRTGSLFHA